MSHTDADLRAALASIQRRDAAPKPIDWQAALVIEPKAPPTDACDHGVTFDAVAARGLSADEVRKRWPRGWGPCPKGCGWDGIAYASYEHYLSGDW